jgi:hypothetical protein
MRILDTFTDLSDIRFWRHPFSCYNLHKRGGEDGVHAKKQAAVNARKISSQTGLPPVVAVPSHQKGKINRRTSSAYGVLLLASHAAFAAAALINFV